MLSIWPHFESLCSEVAKPMKIGINFYYHLGGKQADGSPPTMATCNTSGILFYWFFLFDGLLEDP